eukprot:3325756-Rhodomonas_salina.2
MCEPWQQLVWRVFIAAPASDASRHHLSCGTHGRDFLSAVLMRCVLASPQVAKCIKNTVGGYYRPDLTKHALARWTKLHKSIKKAKSKGAAAAKK